MAKEKLFDYDKKLILTSKTIADCFEERVSKTPGKIAVSYNGKDYSFKDIDNLSNALALSLCKEGAGLDTKIGIWCGNCPGWIVSFIAIQKLGALAVLLNPGYSSEELGSILEYSKCEYLLMGEDFKEKSLKETLSKCLNSKKKHIKKIHNIETDGFLEELKSRAKNLDLNELSAINQQGKTKDVHEPCAMLFTSGTTNTPKGVMLSNYNLVNDSMASAKAMHFDEDDAYCVMVPLFHSFGLTSNLISGIIVGARLCLIKNFKTLKAMEVVQKYKCSVLSGVPSMFLAMINNPEFKNFDLSTLDKGIIAGSMVNPDDYDNITKTLKMNHLQQSYGQTETSPGITFSDFDDTLADKRDNTGYVIDNVDICIWTKDEQIIYSEETLKAMKAGKLPKDVRVAVRGEIGVKGFLVMKGYFEKPEESAKVLEDSGWLHTGDIGYLDEKGQVYINGRIKEIIIRGGENISPYEIEECISRLDAVCQVKCVGVPHPILQEEIAAAITLKEGKTITEEELKQYVKKHLATYKVPAYVVVLDEMPTSASGKIKLCEVKEMILQKKPVH
ncbi:MAG: hypothetical protein E7242_11245 [Lachnospiraceae bacterium]|nr:hypothetical protein [Lachnospiraceae bacterium]